MSDEPAITLEMLCRELRERAEGQHKMGNDPKRKSWLYMAADTLQRLADELAAANEANAKLRAEVERLREDEERIRIAFFEFYHDWKNGDFQLPELAACDVRNVVATYAAIDAAAEAGAAHAVQHDARPDDLEHGPGQRGGVMERVTVEWLYLAESAAYLRAVKSVKDVSSAEWHQAKRLAFAQAVARDCIEVIMCFNDRDEGVRNIRARFGLED